MRTLGSPIFALLMQAQSGAVSGDTTESSILGLIAHSTPLSKAVLMILALLSVGSWAIILYKLWVFRRSEQQSVSFLDVFRRSSKFSEVQAVCRSLTESPLVGLFQSGYAELTAQLRQTGGDEAAGSPRTGAARPTLKSLAAVDRALMRASVVEVNKLESRITFLATTASIAPFVGLFGTVIGIMMSFQMIGETGSTNLASVGPGRHLDALTRIATMPQPITKNTRKASGTCSAIRSGTVCQGDDRPLNVAEE